MKAYPTISRKIQNTKAYVFDKLDGSNIRVEWTVKNGFNKFGSRKRLLGTDQEIIVEAYDLLDDKYQSELKSVFVKQRWQKVTCFFEFWGENSFAGFHENEEHKLTLIDVNPYKSGIMNPDEFVKLFGHMSIAKLLYIGNVNQDIVNQVRNSTFEGMTDEGVVCKIKTVRKQLSPVMFKIKSNAWLKRLKEYCKGDEKMYERLM